MKKLLFLLVLGLYSCDIIERPYYIIKVNSNVYYTKDVIEMKNGIKFCNIYTKDTVEVYGTYTKQYIRPEVNEINHNDYSK